MLFCGHLEEWKSEGYLTVSIKQLSAKHLCLDSFLKRLDVCWTNKGVRT